MAGDPNPTAPSRSAELSGETTVPANHASGGSDAREPEGAIPEEAMTGEAMPGEALAREATAGEATAGEAMTETEKQDAADAGRKARAKTRLGTGSSEERPVGEEWCSTCKSRCEAQHKKKTRKHT